MSLVTVQEYRNFTQDLSTVASEITARIEQATMLIEDELQRPLVEADVTETLAVTWDRVEWHAFVHPTRTPVTAVAVTEPEVVVSQRSTRGRD